MSDIKTLRDDLITKITAVCPATTVAKWAGEADAMSAAKPAVFIQWSGRLISESMEIGAATYVSEPIFHMIVQTADGASDGDDQAATILEAIMGALNEVEIAALGVARPYKEPEWGGKTETLIEVSAGSYGYAQAWKIEILEG